MGKDSNIVGEILGDDDRQVPPRSHLYHVPPIGAGTSEVESATCYLARLALAHSVSTWSMLKCEIAPKLFGNGANLRNRLSELVAAMGSACNGENSTSRRFVSILNSLTGRTDLEQTTMAFVRDFVSPRFLVNVKQAWCRDCLAEWKSNDSTVYYPLLWQLAPVKTCPRHRSPLQRSCHGCSKTFCAWSAQTRPGYCPKCGAWLGSVQREEQNLNENYDFEVSRSVAEFLRHSAVKLAESATTSFALNIETLLTTQFSRNIAHLAKFFGVHRYTVNAWRHKTQRPSLLLLADISVRLNIPIRTLLVEKIDESRFELDKKQHGQRIKKRLKAPGKTDVIRMRGVLEDALKDDVFPSPSLNQIATKLGCNQSTLVRRFPELANRVKKQYLEFCRIEKKVREMLFQSIVKQTVLDIHRAGLYPSQSRVRELVPKFIDMREASVYEQWRRSLAELSAVPQSKREN